MEEITDIERIEAVVCHEYGITHHELKSHRRTRPGPEARFVCFRLLRRDAKKWSLKRIGREYGRDHASVINGLNVLDDLMQTDPLTRERVRRIQATLEETKAEAAA